MTLKIVTSRRIRANVCALRLFDVSQADMKEIKGKHQNLEMRKCLTKARFGK